MRVEMVEILKKALLFTFCTCVISANAQKREQRTSADWPKGSSPVETGNRLTSHFISNRFYNWGNKTPAVQITYPEVCGWYGALRFAQITQNDTLTKKLIERFAPLLQNKKVLIPKPNHVDNTVFGAIPLEIYNQTHQDIYLNLGKPFADAQWESGPDSSLSAEQKYDQAQGLSSQTRMWIDDMYMITLLQVQAYRATHDKKYIERAAKQMAVYLDSLQQPNGLFYHAPDARFFWGRGNGWMAAGMAELLSSLSPQSIYYNRIMLGYKKMIYALRQYQRNDGMWNQLVDDPQAWPETSATAMFTFSMAVGVKQGWLNKKQYMPLIKKAWLALVACINNHDEVTAICEGTNKMNNKQYYLDRKTKTGDMHGQAPMIWCAFILADL